MPLRMSAGRLLALEYLLSGTEIPGAAFEVLQHARAGPEHAVQSEERHIVELGVASVQAVRQRGEQRIGVVPLEPVHELLGLHNAAPKYAA